MAAALCECVCVCVCGSMFGVFLSIVVGGLIFGKCTHKIYMYVILIFKIKFVYKNFNILLKCLININIAVLHKNIYQQKNSKNCSRSLENM